VLSSEIQIQTRGKLNLSGLIFGRGRDFSFLQNVHASLGAHTASYSMGNEVEVARA
jgi:hypothetical protein